MKRVNKAARAFTASRVHASLGLYKSQEFKRREKCTKCIRLCKVEQKSAVCTDLDALRTFSTDAKQTDCFDSERYCFISSSLHQCFIWCSSQLGFFSPSCFPIGWFNLNLNYFGETEWVWTVITHKKIILLVFLEGKSHKASCYNKRHVSGLGQQKERPCKRGFDFHMNSS